MAELLIRGGRLLSDNDETRADVLVRDGVVAAVGERLEVRSSAKVLEADGAVVAPGLVDLHTHLRQPGMEVAETVETGSRAAALGGFTAVVAMPNTEPAIDDASIARDVLALGATALCQVAVAGAITLGRRGERLAPLGELAALGVHLFTDDGAGVQDASLMRQALEYASDLGVVLAQHCQDDSLAAGGHMNEGAWSSHLGIAGQSRLSEEVMLERDLALVGLTGAPMHFLHLSTAGSVALVRRAKKKGLPVTAEVTPHHLFLTDAEVASYDSVYKVNPPLREEADLRALRKGLLDGTVDAVATDHAPHPPERKERPFDEAPFGMLGLETALSVCWTALEGEMALGELIGALSARPARIARLDPPAGGSQGAGVAVGSPANLMVFDPEATFEVEPARLASRSRNTPYAGRKLKGRVRHTIYQGEPVVIDGEAQR